MTSPERAGRGGGLAETCASVAHAAARAGRFALRPRRELVRDVVVVAAGLTAVAGVRLWLDRALPTHDVMWLMALFAAAVGSAAALLGVLLAWLVADQRVGWLSVALACYCLLAVPAGALGARGVLPEAVAVTVTVAAEGAVAALLLLALTVPPSLYRWRARGAALVALGVVVAAGLAAVVVPGVAVATGTSLRLVVALAWTALAVAIAVRTARPRSWGLWRIGAGFSLLGAVHIARLAFPALAADVGLALSNLRLLGVALVFWGVVGLAWRALTDLGSVSAAQEEELRLAEVRLARAAERDHELRSGLAGLAGASAALGRGREDGFALGNVIASELDRLDQLLHAPSLPPRSTKTYEVAPVLAGLAALRRSGGTEVHVATAPGLYAVGSSQTLAQVVTNLLGNVARHAPGSPVWLTARQREGLVLVEVRDAGPGIGPDREEQLFRWGEHDTDAGGSGLGLAVCRRMLEAEDATIALRPADRHRPGCCVVIELPAPGLADRATVPVPREGARRESA